MDHLYGLSAKWTPLGLLRGWTHEATLSVVALQQPFGPYLLVELMELWSSLKWSYPFETFPLRCDWNKLLGSKVISGRPIETHTDSRAM